jgi:hypothetical protein
MRAIGQDGLNIVVSIPRIVIEREAERRTLTIEEFLEQFRAVAEFDSFNGVLYTFEKIVEKATGLEEVGSGKQQ